MSREILPEPFATVASSDYTFLPVESEAEIEAALQALVAGGQETLGLVTIHLRYRVSERAGVARRRLDQLVERGTIYLMQSLRLLVRRTDRVFLCGQSLYFVLLGANLQGAEIVEERLWEALLWRIHGMSEQDLPRPTCASIGHGALPLPQNGPAELLDASQITSRHFGAGAERSFARLPHNAREKGQAEGNEQELAYQARKLGIPYLSSLPARPARRVLQALNARLARELRCYPVGRERNILTVAMLNPQDHQALERLHQETGLLIFPVLTHPQALEHALKQLL